MQGKVLVSTDITGTISGDVLQGRYVSYDSDGNEASGKITGTRIKPRRHDYTPVKVEGLPLNPPQHRRQPWSNSLRPSSLASLTRYRIIRPRIADSRM